MGGSRQYVAKGLMARTGIGETGTAQGDRGQRAAFPTIAVRVGDEFKTTFH